MRALTYQHPSAVWEPSKRELAYLGRAQQAAEQHHSGGSFHIVAMACRSKPLAEIGRNSLTDDPSTKIDVYPAICGRHAELDLWCRSDDLAGSTVYLAGVTKARRMLTSTVPCVYCAALLTAAQVRWVVCRLAGEVIKTRPESLVA